MGCTPSKDYVDPTRSISIILRDNKHLDLITDLIKAFPIKTIEHKSNRHGGGLNPDYYNLQAVKIHEI